MSALLTACGGTSGDGDEESGTNLLLSQPASSDQALSVEISQAAPFQQVNTGTGLVQAVFAQNGTLDLSDLAENAVIDLGLDAHGQPQANQGRVDLDGIRAAHVTLNIHTDTPHIEVDHMAETLGTLSIQLMPQAAPLTLSDPDVVMELLHLQTVSLTHMTHQPAVFASSLRLYDTTETLTIATQEQGGDLTLLTPSGLIPAFRGAGALKHLTLDAEAGDMDLAGLRIFTDDATALQSYQVSAQDADVLIGAIGLGGKLGFENHAIDLENIEVTLTGTSSFSSAQLLAMASQVGSMRLTSTDRNVLQNETNLLFNKFYADTVAYQELNALDGGKIWLTNQAYAVHEQVFTGSGDIHIDAPTGTAFGTYRGYIQTQPAEASAHTGQRIFEDGGQSLDVFYGSNQDDLILFASGYSIFNSVTPGAIYYDSGGQDRVEVRSNDYVEIYDGDAGTDDVTLVDPGSYFGLSARVTFAAGSGQDQLIFERPHPLYGGGQDQVLIDFGTYLNGHLSITGLYTTPNHRMSFDGLPGITVTQGNAVMLSVGSTVHQINNNYIYLVADADQSLQGNAVADYTNLTDVASYLSMLTSQSSPASTHAIFILHNKTTSTMPGDDRDVYFYHLAGDGQATAIQASDLTLFASATLQQIPFASLPLELQTAQIV